jgi:hypothetical protein
MENWLKVIELPGEHLLPYFHKKYGPSGRHYEMLALSFRV